MQTVKFDYWSEVKWSEVKKGYHHYLSILASTHHLTIQPYILRLVYPRVLMFIWSLHLLLLPLLLQGIIDICPFKLLLLSTTSVYFACGGRASAWSFLRRGRGRGRGRGRWWSKFFFKRGPVALGHIPIETTLQILFKQLVQDRLGGVVMSFSTPSPPAAGSNAATPLPFQ